MGLSFPGTGTQIDKLWENPNLGAAFGAQKIALDLSAYDAVYIVCSLQGAYSQRKCELAPKGAYVSIQIFSFSDKLPGSVRQAQIDNTGVIFTDGYYYNWSNSTYTVSNQSAMPISIYGVRF